MWQKLWQRIKDIVALLWREVAKFGVVGIIGFFIDSGIFLWLMSGPMEGSNVKAKIVATAVATIFSWVANRFWTFRNRRQSNVVREFVLFIVMNAIGAAIQAGCVFIAQYGFGVTSAFGLLIAGNVIGMFFGTVFRFFAYRFWVFTETVEADPQFLDDEKILTGEMSIAEINAAQQGEDRGGNGPSSGPHGGKGGSGGSTQPRTA